jgi:hypothetical protein
MANHFISGRLARIAPLFGWIVVCCAPTANAADLVNPGQYEWTMKTNADAPRVISTCVTPEVAAMTNGDSRSGREAAAKANKGRCSIQEYEVAGNHVSYRITCGDKVMVSSTTYHGNTSEGDLTTTTTAAGAAHVDRMHVTAKRLGPCK